VARGNRPSHPCGTPAAARRHWRHGEPPCGDCLNAYRADQAERRGYLGNGQSPDYREIRNGLPWKPYVYNGRGYDIYEEEAS
jgi:hypothetical protein